jgi:hypothetical protein
MDIASTQKPTSAGLARRLAAAADGYLNGKIIWFIARYEPVDGSYDISEAIEQDDRPADPVDADYGVFGPYRNDAVDTRHTPVIAVTLHLKNGRNITLEDPKCDAVFWSASAIRKFVLPHYAEYVSLEYARKIETDFRVDPDIVALTHAPNTEYTMKRSTDGTAKFLTV